MLLDNVKELIRAQEIINEVDLAILDENRTLENSSIQRAIKKEKLSIVDRVKKHEILIVFVVMFLLEIAVAFQLALCVRVVGINKTFIFIMCFLEMILLFIIGFYRLNNERKLELEMYHKVIEKKKLLENINASTKERKEYLLYLDNLLKKTIDTLKIE
nr:hypothetical protein [uncultured Faecalibacillus sp.]